jgi:cyclase
MDHDGTRAGYPCPVYADLSDALSIPLIASGGAGSVADIAAVLTIGKADAALAASIFHYGQYTVAQVKKELAQAGIPVRL